MAFYRGLNNTVAEGADGFKDFLQIIDELECVGAERIGVKKFGRGFRRASCI